MNTIKTFRDHPMQSIDFLFKRLNKFNFIKNDKVFLTEKDNKLINKLKFYFGDPFSHSFLKRIHLGLILALIVALVLAVPIFFHNDNAIAQKIVEFWLSPLTTLIVLPLHIYLFSCIFYFMKDFWVAKKHFKSFMQNYYQREKLTSFYSQIEKICSKSNYDYQKDYIDCLRAIESNDFDTFSKNFKNTLMAIAQEDEQLLNRHNFEINKSYSQIKSLLENSSKKENSLSLFHKKQ